MWGDIAIAFLLAFITAFVITPHTMRLAKKVGAIDIPNDRRVNKKPMPRLRRISCNCRIFRINYLFINICTNRRKNRFIWC
jgi:UDP-N-acetylmuramyl pentapeptide phosphotransferase/UDP-N-acetylglucosamine-1-phosphate transferase